MIRVLHFLGSMNQGGAENFVMNLYRSIDKTKIQFDFLVNREGIFDQEIKSMGGKIFLIPALQNIGQIQYTRNLDRFFKEHKEYQIVHSHINQVTGLILEIANKNDIPVRIAHSHSSKSAKNPIVRIYKDYLGSKINKNATILFGCSDKANEWLYKKNKDKAIIINNGVDVEKYRYNIETRQKIRKELKIKDNEIVIGHVGRFSKVKNHSFLLDIFKFYCTYNPHSKLILVGDGELKNDILNKIKELELQEKVLMLGNIDNVHEVNQAMDYFVFPSFYEGLPVSLVEAQISGLKVFASDRITKMVQVTNNIKFLDINESAQIWAEEILSTQLDRKDMSEDVIKEGYDIREIAKKYIKLLGCD